MKSIVSVFVQLLVFYFTKCYICFCVDSNFINYIDVESFNLI